MWRISAGVMSCSRSSGKRLFLYESSSETSLCLELPSAERDGPQPLRGDEDVRSARGEILHGPPVQGRGETVRGPEANPEARPGELAGGALLEEAFVEDLPLRRAQADEQPALPRRGSQHQPGLGGGSVGPVRAGYRLSHSR